MANTSIVYGAWALLACDLGGLNAGKIRRSASVSNIADGWEGVEAYLHLNYPALPSGSIEIYQYSATVDKDLTTALWTTTSNTDLTVNRLEGTEQLIWQVQVPPIKTRFRLRFCLPGVMGANSVLPSAWGLLVRNRSIDFGNSATNFINYRGWRRATV